MPRILIDLRMVRGRLHGISRYAVELARRLPALAPDWDFVGLTGPAGLDASTAVQIPLLRCGAEYLSPLEQPALLASILKAGCDLVHATSFSVPALWPGSLVVTLHDVNHLALPENYGPGRVAYYRLVVGPRARSARAVLTVSEFSRGEICSYLGLSPASVQVIHPGVDQRYRPAAAEELQTFRRTWGLSERYFAIVGNTKRHKNLELIAQLARSLPAPVALLAGAGAKRDLKFPSNTIEIEKLPEEEMPRFYSGALALLLPSRYEGFGLPALEAMGCGCPVVASRASSLPEVVGDAGILLSPDDPAGWLAACTRLLNDGDLRRRLSALGRTRAPQFSWDLCAQQVLAVYARAL